MRLWILAIATVAVLVGVAGGAYWYGGNGANESALVLNRAPAASDGIKVHGDWTVTVSNPDGSVDSVHEFRNKLVGNHILMLLMRGEGIVKFDGEGHPSDDGTNKWKIAFDSDNNNANASTQWAFADTSFVYPDLYTSWTEMEAFQLKGSIVVPPGRGDITMVRSMLSTDLCEIPSIDDCDEEMAFTLTEKHFDNPIPAVPGQLVATTVRITFE